MLTLEQQGATMSRMFAATLILFLLSGAAEAAWQADGIPACTASGPQIRSSAVLGANGGVIVCWQDSRLGTAHIYAQRFSADGVPQWSTDGVLVTNVSREQSSPCAVSDGVGGVILAYVELQPSTGIDIYAQRINASGVPLWGDGVPLCSEFGQQLRPSIISDGRSGITDTPGAIVVWEDDRTGNNTDIYAQAIDADGNVQWTTQGVAVCSDFGEQGSPTMVTDGIGFFGNPKGAIIAWEDNRDDQGDIYAQHVNSAGNAQWTSNGVAVCDAANWQRIPSITYVGDGNAIIAWWDLRSGVYDIWAQRIGPAGSWLEDGLPVCRALDDQLGVVATTDGADGAILAWLDRRNDGTNGDVYAQRVDGFGNPLWPVDGVPVSSPTGDQSGVVIAPGLDQGAIVLWRDLGISSDIYAQRISANGARLWDPNDVPVCTASGFQFETCVVPDGAGGVYASWTDPRTGQNDIYAQRVMDTPVSVAFDRVLPTEFQVLGAAPNPFAYESSLRFVLPATASLSAHVHSADGRLIRTLMRDRSFDAGTAELRWDGRDAAGLPAPSGFYFVRIDVGSESATSKILLMR
jgi:FlgD Ig-like domain